tara:strand:- start:729 stop:1343 length:615 start_codon:yes stop_codon:yes gene_type:complete
MNFSKYPFFICLGLLPFLGGCISLLPEASSPPREFTLDFLGGEKKLVAPSKDLVIKIDKTIAAAPLQAQRILLLSKEAGLIESHYLADVVWHEPLASLVQCRLIEAIRNGGMFKGVGYSQEAFKPDLLYLPALHHFEIEKGAGTYKAVVSLSLREVSYQDHSLQRERVFYDERPVSESLEAFVTGLNQSFLKILIEAVNWIEKG